MIQVNTSSNLPQTAQKVQNKPGKKTKKGKGDSSASRSPTKVQNREAAYHLALTLTAIIEEDLTRETRHYRTRDGQLLITLDQVIRAALNKSLLITVPGDTTFYVPPTFATCPYCGGKLYAGFRAWVLEDDGTWTGQEIELECENEPDIEADEEAWEWWLESHSEMPYVYWLPVCEKIKRWINSQYRFAKGEFEERNSIL